MTLQKYTGSLYKGKVNWCPKKLRWNLVVIQVSGYLKFPRQKKFPLVIKAGARSLNKHQSSLLWDKERRLSEAAITQEAHFQNTASKDHIRTLKQKEI